MITQEELAEALKSIRLWVTVAGFGNETAFRGKVLHPEDAAKDILTSIEVRRQRCDSKSR